MRWGAMGRFADKFSLTNQRIRAHLTRDNLLPERALLHAVNEGNRLLLSQEVENEYCEVIFRPNSIDAYPLSARREFST